MSRFTVQVGKEKVEVSFIVGCLNVCYKGKNYLIEPDEIGWKQRVGNLDDKTVQAIGKAIEKYIQRT